MEGGGEGNGGREGEEGTAGHEGAKKLFILKMVTLNTSFQGCEC